METSLARNLGVSRTPVREALRLIVNEGLATSTRGGVVVTQLTIKDVHDLMQTSRVLHGPACRLAVARATEAQMERLEELMRQLEAAADASDLKLFNQADANLNRYIAEMASNIALIRFLDQVNSLLARIRHLAARHPGRPQQSKLENRRVVDAIRRRDGEEAETAMHEHIQAGQDVVISILENLSSPSRENGSRQD